MKRGLFMSYMNTHAAFAPAGGIQELSFDEIEEVGGGPAFIPAIVGYLSTPAGVASVAAAGAVVTAAVALVTSARSDDCTTIYKYNAKGQLVSKKITCN
jgi:hypothetical protein